MSMTGELDTRLNAALEQRTDLEAKKQRLEGKLEAARKALLSVEEECRTKGVEPASLDATIEKLITKYEGLVEQLEREIEAANLALSPFLKES